MDERALSRGRVAGLLAVLVLGCSAPAAEPSRDGEVPPGELSTEAGAVLRDVPGTVVRVGDFGWGLVPAADPGTRFAADQLPEEFAEDALPVLFGGVVGEVPRGARLWGIPFEVKQIRRRDGGS